MSAMLATLQALELHSVVCLLIYKTFMQLHLQDGRIFSIGSEKLKELKTILTDKNIPDDEVIKGSKTTIKKGDIKLIKEGNYVYTKDGLFSVEKEKPLLFKLYHSNIATDFFIIEESELPIAIEAMLNRKHYSYKGRVVIPAKILPHVNNHFGWNDDYVPTGEFVREAKAIENRLQGVLDTAFERIESGNNKTKRLN